MKNPAPKTPAVKKPDVAVTAPARLSDAGFAPDLTALRQRLLEDPAYGKSLLRKAGIVNAKGRLTRSFGG